MNIQKFNNGETVLFRNIAATMTGKIERAKAIADSFKYYIKVLDVTGNVSTFEVFENEVRTLPAFDSTNTEEHLSDIMRALQANPSCSQEYLFECCANAFAIAEKALKSLK